MTTNPSAAVKQRARELVDEAELRKLERRMKKWETIPKAQYPCSWGSLERLLKTVRRQASELSVKDAEIDALEEQKQEALKMYATWYGNAFAAAEQCEQLRAQLTAARADAIRECVTEIRNSGANWNELEADPNATDEDAMILRTKAQTCLELIAALESLLNDKEKKDGADKSAV